jgi:uncharacterized protein YkwD
LPNGYKLIIVLCVLVLFYWAYNHQEKYIPLVKTNFEKIPFSNLNPFSLNLSSINQNSVTNTTHNTLTQTLDTIFKPEDSISDKTKQIEQSILQYTNQERQKEGLRPLQWDSALADVARSHSLDMVTRNFFAHVNPSGQDPTARAIAYGYNVHKELGGGWYSNGIGENIGKMPTGNVEGAGYVSNDADSIAKAQVQSWMGSPGHRANILNSKYDVIGVGVAFDKSLYYYLTQDFK